jgi:hypothetical protein
LQRNSSEAFDNTKNLGGRPLKSEDCIPPGWFNGLSILDDDWVSDGVQNRWSGIACSQFADRGTLIVVCQSDAMTEGAMFSYVKKAGSNDCTAEPEGYTFPARQMAIIPSGVDPELTCIDRDRFKIENCAVQSVTYAPRTTNIAIQ